MVKGEKNNLLIIAIVGIVAIVALMIFSNGGTGKAFTASRTMSLNTGSPAGGSGESSCGERAGPGETCGWTGICIEFNHLGECTARSGMDGSCICTGGSTGREDCIYRNGQPTNCVPI